MLNMDNFSSLTPTQHAGILFPISRSLAGEGTRKTLAYFESYFPLFQRERYSSGLKVFDWTIPNEWTLRHASLIHVESQTIIADTKTSNLHVVSHSTPVDCTLSLDELIPHLHTLPDQPDSVPYVTSYYAPTWGFCISHNTFNQLLPGSYHVHIDAIHKPGHLDLTHTLLPGECARQILFSSYICHPSMANNELSGPILLSLLLEYIQLRYPSPRLSYRFILCPETIGSIAYISRHLDDLQQNLVAGFILSCVGDPGPYSVVHTPYENTLPDQALRAALLDKTNAIHYSFLDRGSDERQYNSPRVKLPVCTFSRSKFGTYPQYHTDKDDLSILSDTAFYGSLQPLCDIVDSLELGLYPLSTSYCEPHLSKYSLYPTTSIKSNYSSISQITHLIAYSDGSRTLFDISLVCNIPLGALNKLVRQLAALGLLTLSDSPTSL